MRREASAVVIDGIDGRSRTDSDAALQRTRTSLEAQFDRVVIGPENALKGASPVSPADALDPADAWCLVTAPVAGGVPPDLVNTMFRRRTKADAVVAVTRSDDRDVVLAACRRELLSEVIPIVEQGPAAIAELGDRRAVREVRLGRPASGAGLEGLPETARRDSVSGPARRRGAEAP